MITQVVRVQGGIALHASKTVLMEGLPDCLDLLRKVHALRTPGTRRCACAPFPGRTSSTRRMHPNTTRESHAVSSAGRCLFQRRDTAKHPGAAKATGASVISSKRRSTSSRLGRDSRGEIIPQFCCLCVFGFFADSQCRQISGRRELRWDSSDTLGRAVLAIVERQRYCSRDGTNPRSAGIR